MKLEKLKEIKDKSGPEPPKIQIKVENIENVVNIKSADPTIDLLSNNSSCEEPIDDSLVSGSPQFEQKNEHELELDSQKLQSANSFLLSFRWINIFLTLNIQATALLSRSQLE